VFGSSFQRLYQITEPTGLHFRVIIQEKKIPAASSSRALIAGINKAAILFVPDHSNNVGKVSKDFGGAIAGGVVHHNDFIRAQVDFLQERIKALPGELGFVENRNDD
jgi:hypothetical protein